MKKYTNRLRKRIYPIIWSGIIMMSLYLIFRFMTLSFSDDVGQAGESIKDRMFSGLCSKIMEDGAALISYAANDQSYVLPAGLSTTGFALAKYSDDTPVWTVQAMANTYPLQKESLVETWDADETMDAVETLDTSGVQNEPEIYDIQSDLVSMEYILTNGAIYNSTMAGNTLVEGSTDLLQFTGEEGDIYYEEETSEDDSTYVNADGFTTFTMDQLKDFDFLIKNFYTVHPTTKAMNEVFDGEKLVGMDMTLKQDNSKPQILILHTHSQEAFIDSRKEKPEDTVVGVGTHLTEILEEDYGYNVIHDTTTYDIINGSLDRSKAYTIAKYGITKTLEENPSIEVVIDLHRDAGDARTVVINGKETARVMLFNGLSRNKDGPMEDLPNPNLQYNLAFSLQMQLESYEIYPGLFLKNFLKPLRFNMNLRQKYLLVELGTEMNTLESAMNAMEPFAEVLDGVLQGE